MRRSITGTPKRLRASVGARRPALMMAGEKGGNHMSESRIKKLLRAAEIIRDQSEQETGLDQLVAVSMQTGYQLGYLTAKATA